MSTPIASSSSVTAQAFAPPFTEIRFTFWRPNQHNYEKATPRSPQEEAAFIQNLSEEIERTHQYANVRIELATPPPQSNSWYRIEPLPPPLPSAFHEHFTVSGHDGKYYLGPKILRETPIDNSKMKRIEYANGVIEESEILSPELGYRVDRKGTRTFPDGRVEKGIFSVSEKRSFQGVRSQKDCKDVYVDPKSEGPLLYYNHETKKVITLEERGAEEKLQKTKIPGLYSRVVFAVMEKADGKHLEALIAINQEENEYTLLEHITLFEALVPVAQNSYCLSKLMKTIDARAFIAFLLSGDRPIMSLNDDSLLAVLNQARKLNVPIDLHQVDEATQETLFSKYADSTSSIELIQCMLEMDPSAIDQIQTLGKKRSFVSTSLLKGNDQVAKLLLGAAEKRQIPITVEDRWILRAYKNDTSFVDEEFKSLSPECQDEIYGIANTFNCYELSQRLRGLLGKAEEVALQGPSVFSPTMDCAHRKDVAEQFLVDLRKKGRLLTASEYAQKKRPDTKYWDKKCDIGRFLGCNYIESVAAKLGLTRIKTPIKYAVLEKDIESISVKVDKHQDYLGIESLDFRVWSQDVSTLRIYATYGEMVELVDFLAESLYWDTRPDNFIIAQDGIYIIDTEFDNFNSTPNTLQWESIVPMCEPDTRRQLVDYMNAKLKTLKANPAAAQQSEALLKKFGLANVKPMVLNTSDIMNPKTTAPTH